MPTIPEGVIAKYCDVNGVVHRFYEDGESDTGDVLYNAGAEMNWEHTHVLATVNGMSLNETTKYRLYGKEFCLFDQWREEYHIRHPVFVLKDAITNGCDFMEMWNGMVWVLMQFSETVEGDVTVPWIREERALFRESFIEILKACEHRRNNGRFGGLVDFYDVLWGLYGDQPLAEAPGGILEQRDLIPDTKRPPREEATAPPSIPPDLI